MIVTLCVWLFCKYDAFFIYEYSLNMQLLTYLSYLFPTYLKHRGTSMTENDIILEDNKIFSKKFRTCSIYYSYRVKVFSEKRKILVF